MSTQNKARRLVDSLLVATTAMPAANANNNSAAIDLEAVAPGLKVENIDLELVVPALPSLADTISATWTFQDSANGTDFDAIPGLSTLTRTGAASAGSAATTRKVKLPPSVRRYVRVNQAVANTGGNNTAVSTTLRLLF